MGMARIKPGGRQLQARSPGLGLVRSFRKTEAYCYDLGGGTMAGADCTVV